MPGFTSAVLLQRHAETEDLDRQALKRLNLSPSELTPYARAKIWKACKEDEDFFIYNFVRTRDEHAPPERSIRPFPEEPTTRELLHVIRTEKPPIFVPKSRQLRVTWVLAAHCVHRIKFFKNRFVFWQSKKEKDAWNIVFYKDWPNARMSFIEMHLPPWLRSEECQGVVGQLFYPTGSRAWGIPQGAHMLRSYTATDVVMDECAFWDAFQKSYEAALPMVAGGGSLICVSSANAGSPMAKLIGEGDDDLDD